MRGRRGFTLLEVLVALVVSGLVVTLAYASAQAGLDTEARLDAHRGGRERAAAIRALLGDALRHQLEGIRGGEAVFVLSDRVATDGQEADSLTFATRGIVAPYGTSAPWRVDAWRSHDTLRVAARPVDAGDATPPVMAALPHVTAFDVQVLGRGLAAGWRGAWPDADVSPDAVALTVQRAAEEPLQLVIRRGLERAP